MWFWILVISMSIFILAIFEETIQFLVNRKVFGKSDTPVLVKEKLNQIKNKLMFKKSHSQ
ncbi:MULTISPECIES: hypothetical protein [unclassified Cytobacillus]|mgnify:CR=1 FL=1|uniref:hypothetical protein n=1 Tax=unclassified Cytobacillus TaxID=2675268 RepID=UPI0013590556|nr:hypothetical protein [Cytobacillus sp. AMY 15.2]KAF0819822.1 hypothetical protein KIS4809_1094 [Bacillus sp. ZZV12-4809]MCM3092305.1 hypothetical protein [Cytobacillus sp. AMY 15.2]